jgi:signal transduction histidine kinase
VPTEYLAPHEPWDSALSLAKEAVETHDIATARVHYEVSGRTWDLWCRPPHGRSAVLVVARDVTAVVELQESLRQKETMAALGSVVVGVAHEVRNPLFTISSLVDAWSIQKQLRDPQPLMDALRREVVRVNSLMTELLEYGRPAPVVLEPCKLSAILNEAILACRAQAEARSVRVVLNGAGDAEVWSDPRRLPRVFINLITNAIQHSPTESEVIVSATAPSSSRSATVTVRDQGAGFSEGDLPRLFTPFFSRRAGGFGLGLAISARIISEHRGKVTAANHPDGGAVVTVSLPLTPPDRQIRVTEGARPC